MDSYLLLPRIKLHNVSAANSFIAGLPSMTAFLGGVHALERRLHTKWSNLDIIGTAIAVHEHRMHSYRETSGVASLIGTANPLQKNSKTGEYSRPPFIEEARADMTVSLLLKLSGITREDKEAFLDDVAQLVPLQKMAAGDIVSLEKPSISFLDPSDEKAVRRVRNSLMPSYVIVDRCSMLIEHQQQTGLSAMDAIIDLLAIHYEPGEELGKWSPYKRTPGYLVPLAVGFKDLAGNAPAAGTRDGDTEHHFVEPVITLGELCMPYRFETLEDMLWHFHYDNTNGLYLCQCGTNLGERKNG